MFKRNPSRCQLATHTAIPIKVVSSVQEEKDGVITTKVVTSEKNLLNAEDFPQLPSRLEYSVANQMAAGVNMQEIPGVRSLQNPTDPSVIDGLNAANVESGMQAVETSNFKEE